MFGLFKKKKPLPEANYSVLRTDMHSHILPGIDDGAKTVEDAVAMAKRFESLGYEKLVATPHIMADFFRNTPDTIKRSKDVLQKAFDTQGIKLQLDAAAEYYLDETFEKKITKKELLTFGSNQVLFELSYINMPHNVEETVERLRDAGYSPVLAHPERYPYFHSGIENYLRIRELGCSLQLNTISLTGYYGKSTRQAAEMLLEHQAIDLMGSDMHHLRHADALADALHLPLLQEYFKENQLGNLGL